jgi:hypothetical protein
MQIPAPLESADSKDPMPLPVRQSAVWAWITPALSVAVLAVVAWHFRNFDFNQLVSVVPRNPLFWAVFVAYYFVGTFNEFFIYKWLWKIPVEGFIALLRKNISNGLLVDYLGEAYFYSWARRKVKMEGSPFGAVKDVSILSALVSNLTTLALMAIAYPYARTLQLGFSGQALLASIGVITLISTGIVVFGKRIFSLSRKQLWGIAGMHLGALVVGNGLQALAWSLALPNVQLSMWLLLATAKMLLSRLPLIPNKDVLLVGFAIVVIGHDTQLQVLLAFMATLIFVTHLVLGSILAVGDLVTIRTGSRDSHE